MVGNPLITLLNSVCIYIYNDVFLCILCPTLVMITTKIACLRSIYLPETVWNPFYDYFIYFSVLHIRKLSTKGLDFLSHSQSSGHGRARIEWIRKLWYIYTMEYYSAITKNIFESVLMRWMKLEPIIQSEVSQKEKHQYCILTHIYGI